MAQIVGTHDLALVISDLSSGGAQRVVTTLANYWAQADRRIAVITLADEKSDYFELDPKVDRIVTAGIGASHSVFGAAAANFRRAMALRRSLKQVNAPTVVAFVGATNVLTVLATVGLRLKLVISERNDPARQSLGGVWDFLRWAVYRFAGLVTANSQSALGTLSGYVPANKLRLVRNPILTPDQASATSREPMILTVGRLVDQKAQDVLLAAFADIASKAPDWRLVIIGEGPNENALKERASTLVISGRTKFAGRTDPWPYYARAAIFALPSLYEGTSNALLEAMSMGVTPVISDTSGGSLDIVVDGNSGLVTPSNNVGALAEALRRLTNDPDLCLRLGREAKKSVSAMSLPSVASEWEALLGLSHGDQPNYS